MGDILFISHAHVSAEMKCHVIIKADGGKLEDKKGDEKKKFSIFTISFLYQARIHVHFWMSVFGLYLRTTTMAVISGVDVINIIKCKLVVSAIVNESGRIQTVPSACILKHGIS